VASGSKLEITDTAINAKTTLKASNIQEYVPGQGVLVDGIKIQDARLINSSSSQDYLRLDPGGADLNSSLDMNLNASPTGEMNLRLGGVPKIKILDAETTISNNLKVDSIVENTAFFGVNVDGLQIKDARITNLIDGASNLRLDSNGVSLNSGGAIDLNANGIGYEMNLRLNGDPKINIKTNETTINNDLKTDIILKNSDDKVTIEGSQFRTGGLATINELTVLDALDVSNNVISNVENGVNLDEAVNRGQLNGKLDLSGGTMSGNLFMGNFKVKSDAETIDNNDYTTKTYVDGQVNLKLDASEKADPNGVCPLVNDLIPNQYLPELAITDVYVVENNTARDQLLVQKGDVAIVSNPANNFIWAGPPVTVLPQPDPNTNWKQLVVPEGSVTSVNSLTGNVTLTTNEISEGGTNYYYTPTQEAKVLKKNGTVGMTGNLNMNSNRITDLLGPLNPDNATNKSYVDSGDNLRLLKTGGSVTGPIYMSGNTIQTTFVPTTTNDLTNKLYVDDGNTTRLKADGSIVMTGDLNLGGNDLLNTNEINISSIKQLNPVNDILCENLDFQQTNVIKNVPQIQTASLSILNPNNPVTAYTPFATSPNTPFPYIYTTSSPGVDPTKEGWKAFHTKTTFENWITAQGLYNQLTGLYLGGVATSLNGGSLSGEWAQIDTSILHTIDAYKAILKPLPYDPYGAVSWVICGSTDGINFTTIDSQTDYVSVGGNPPPTYTFPITQSPPYRYFRMIITKKEPNSNFTQTVMQGLQFNITPSGALSNVDIQGDLDVTDKIICDLYESFTNNEIQVKSINNNARLASTGASFDTFVSSQKDVYLTPANNAVINAGNAVATNAPDHYFGNGGLSTNIYASVGGINILQDTNKDCWGSAMRTDGTTQLLTVGAFPAQIQFNGQNIASQNMGTDATFFIFVSQVGGFYKYDFSCDCQPSTNNDATLRMLIYNGGSEIYRQESFCMKGVDTSHSITYIDRTSRSVGTGYEIRLEAITSSINLRYASFNLVRLHDNN
jgi:hypothetical protein